MPRTPEQEAAAVNMLAFLIRHPDQHDQDSWVCGTTACAGGTVLLQNGYTRLALAPLHGRGEGHFSSWWFADPDGEPLDGSVSERAGEILGLTDQEIARLFYAHSEEFWPIALDVFGRRTMRKAEARAVTLDLASG